MEYKRIFPVFSDDKTCEFNLWAPKARDIKLVLTGNNREIPMTQGEHGYWSLKSDDISPGTLYKYKIDNGESFPDPASLSQPESVHGPSEVIRLDDFEWSDQQWINIPPEKMIQYELHTGTFTETGNFEGMISRLPYLKDLGINTIELLPVARFSGKRNWGYDGVYPFAVHHHYGGAKKLMQLVNECHKQGIAVILDVVYNHLGPEGNYTSVYGPYFSGKYSTPWGKPMNFDGPYSDGVRNFVIQNALMWCRDFHIDGLRLDAIHAIYDFGARHILKELAENLEHLSRQMKKSHYLIAESDLNDVRYISSFEKGGCGLDAQWSDDFHHAVHSLVTKEDKGYYMDYGKARHLSKAIKDSFVYDGKYSAFRKKTYGSSTKNNPAKQFVIFTQNHDQTGNRKSGERLISLSGFETAKLAAGTMFVSPNIPMLFMGEEYAETKPFYYFVSHLDARLNELVRKGRSEEFKDHYESKEEAPDPSSPDTFKKSKLSWNISDGSSSRAMLEYYKTLITIRKGHPVLRVPDKDNLEITEKDLLFTLRRWREEDHILSFMNYSDNEQSTLIPDNTAGRFHKILDSAESRFNGYGQTCSNTADPGDRISIPGKTIIIYSNKPL